MTALRLSSVVLALLVTAMPAAAQTPADPATGTSVPAPAPAAVAPPSEAQPATAPPPDASPAPSTGETPQTTSGAPPADASNAAPAVDTPAAPTATESAPVTAEAPPPPPPPEPTLIVSADLGSQRVTITENGKVKYTWPISSGTRGYRTKTGRFTPAWTSRMHYSRQWDWAPMPYAVFFNRGTAFHGTYATRALGRPASHGCIRLTTANAKTLYNLVHRHGLKMTRVVVHGAPNFKDPAVARRRGRAIYAERYPPPRYGRRGYAYADPYFERQRRRRYVARPYRGPYGGLWD